MPFQFFRPGEPVAVTRRRLPHWEQEQVAYFVTFRTVDSVPAPLVKEWLEARDGWLRRQGLDPGLPDWRARLGRLSPALREEFRRRFTEKFQDLLDAGHGECVLRRPEVARIVADALLYEDGAKYHIGDFVVMPNHVHVLVQLMADTTLKGQCSSWKRFTATRINRLLGRRGHFWQGESHDRIVRSAEDVVRYREYIAENPRKAQLREGEYLLHRGPDL